MTRTPVTVLGLGRMGRALAAALLDAGHPTTVWNRTPARAAGLVAAGAVPAATVAEAVAASPLVIVCVPDHAAVDEVLAAAGEPGPEVTLVNLTNGTPADARAVAERVPRYLDGGIMAVPSLIATPAAVVLYSGSPGAFAEHRATLAVLGTPHHLGEDPGLAPLHDLALLAAMYGMFGGFPHASALVRSAGLPVAEFTRTLLIPWLTAMAGTLPEMADQVDTGEYLAPGRVPGDAGRHRRDRRGEPGAGREHRAVGAAARADGPPRRRRARRRRPGERGGAAVDRNCRTGWLRSRP